MHETHRWRKPDSNLRYRGRCRRSGRSPCLDRADSGRSRLRNRTAGVDPFEPFLASKHPAKTAIRRRLAHIAPSSLCGRLAGRCPAEMRGEKGAHLRLRVLGSRLVVFEPVAEIADACVEQVAGLLVGQQRASSCRGAGKWKRPRISGAFRRSDGYVRRAD